MIDPVTGKKLPPSTEDPFEVMEVISLDLARAAIQRQAKREIAKRYGFNVKVWKKYDKDNWPGELFWW